MLIKKRIRVTAFLLSALLTVAPIAVSADDQEVAIGKAEAAKLAKKGEIIESSPYYKTLRPIAQRIARVADPQYPYPFRFILVHEKAPNAFAVPGGSVYVTDSLMTFVTNKEELAGVLCHETSHDIHHDVVHNLNKTRTLTYAATALSLLIGGGIGGNIAGGLIGVAADVQSLHYSREVESQADAKGAETCAAAGFNPWGMVWLLERFSNTGSGTSMEVLSDHPTDTHRIAALRAILGADPVRYGRFSPDIKSATPLSLSPRARHTPGPVEEDPTF